MSDRAIASAGFLVDPFVADSVLGFAEASQSIADIEGVNDSLSAIIRRFGVDHFVLYQATDRARRPSSARIAGRNNFAWRKHYVDHGFADRDDLLKSGLTSAAPTTWTKFRSSRRLTQKREAVYDDARVFGLTDGFYLPLHQPDGSMLGVSMMAADRLETDPRTLAALHMLAVYYSLAAERLGLTPALEGKAATRLDLTPRQLECLKWVCAGKSAWEIGEILNLSEHTVNEYLEDARRRLGVRTTTQAAVTAALRGLIVV